MLYQVSGNQNLVDFFSLFSQNNILTKKMTKIDFIKGLWIYTPRVNPRVNPMVN